MNYPDKFLSESVKENSDFPLFSASELKAVYSFLNALRRMEVVGGEVIYSDVNIKFVVSGSGGGSGTSSTPNNYYSASIYCLARYS